jgi:hypothetical protein
MKGAFMYGFARPEVTRQRRTMMNNQAVRMALATAMLWIGFGAGGRTEASGIALSTPAGLVYGDTFRFAFITDDFMSGSSSNIADYNNFVNTESAGATYNGSIVSWVAIGSTSSVNAIDNVGQSASPVYLADGTLVTSSTTSTGLWSGSLQNPIDEDLSGSVLKFLAVLTGTTTSGVASRDPLGNFSSITIGDSGETNARWVQGMAIPSFLSERMYGISQVLTVVPEPSGLVMAGTAIIGTGIFGWSRSRSDHRRQKPVGPTDATE